MRKLLLCLFSHRLLAIARWDLHFLAVRLKNRLRGQRSTVRNFTASRAKPTYLNLGSGPRGLDDPCWVNIDGYSDTNVHFLMDFSRPLPFDDDSLDGVFCEHVMEHFTLADGEMIMREVHRCLRLGGAIRIVVPDAETIMRTYFNAPRDFSPERGATPMEAVNSYFRQRYEHQFAYDWQAMMLMLRRAGFSRVDRWSFGAGGPEGIILDHPKYAWESLYVIAIK